MERFVAQITEFPCLLVLGATTTRPDHQPTQPTNAIHPIPLGHQSNRQKPWGWIGMLPLAVNPETEDDVDKCAVNLNRSRAPTTHACVAQR